MPSILITGASRGLGLEFARQYAGEGWRVFATCRAPDGAEALGAVGGAVSIHRLDVGDRQGIGALADELAGEAIDVLLNNAGVYGPRNPGLETMDYDAWAETLRINTLSPFAMIAAFVDHVARGDQRKIVALSSRMGSMGDNSAGGSYIYRSSKAALNAVMKSLSIDLAGRGMTCCVLHPGWVRTDMGGPGGAIDAPESVAGMRRVIARLSPKDNGRFYNYDGAEIPW